MSGCAAGAPLRSPPSCARTPPTRSVTSWTYRLRQRCCPLRLQVWG